MKYICVLINRDAVEQESHQLSFPLVGDGVGVEGPLSSKFGTRQTVKARV